MSRSTMTVALAATPLVAVLHGSPLLTRVMSVAALMRSALGRGAGVEAVTDLTRVLGSRSPATSPLGGGPGPAPLMASYGAGVGGVASGGGGVFFVGAAVLLAVLGLGLPWLLGRRRLLGEWGLFPQFVLLLADPG